MNFSILQKINSDNAFVLALIIVIILASYLSVKHLTKYVRANLTFREAQIINSSNDYNDKIDEMVASSLKKHLQSINKEISGNYDNLFKIMEDILASYNFTEESLVPLKEYLNTNLKFISEQVLKEFEESQDGSLNIIKTKIDEYLQNSIEYNTLLKVAKKKDKKNEDRHYKENYDSHLKREYQNAIKFKGVMINLFIFINVSLIALIFIFIVFKTVFSSSATINYPLELALSFSGIYISFGAFVIYVVKFSNARTLTILSLQEDFYKQTLISKILFKTLDKSSVNEHDTSLIKNLLSNKSQHEQKTKHPYEILLSGVSNSNIQFKGGKFEISKNESKPKD